MTEAMELGRRILDHRQAIAAAVVARYDTPEIDRGASFGIDLSRFEHYAGYDVSYLSYSLQCGRPELMEHYVRWLYSMLDSHGVPAAFVVPATLRNLRAAIHETLADDRLDLVDEVLDRVERIESSPSPPESFLSADSAQAELAERYLRRLLASDRRNATRLITDAIEGGVSIRDIYLEVLEPVQREVGRLWQIQEISVAREHFASATTQVVMSQLYGRIFDIEAERNGRSVVAACIGDELHEIGLRMVADMAEISGWDTVFLGANTPTPSIAQTIEESGADALALSCAMIVHVERIRQTIEYVRSSGFDELPILVGGYPFNLAPELAEAVGAEASAPEAASAVEVLDAL